MADQSDDQVSSKGSKVSKASGVTWSLLPGESNDQYQRGLTSTIEELGAKTHLQVYVAEKIFQCLWWMRRYETQKRSTIISQMVKELVGFSDSAEKKESLSKLLSANQYHLPEIVDLFKSKGYTPESLLAHAMSRALDEINQLDQLIALRIKSLTSLQQSYEALVNRSIVQERLKLQNDLLKRDLSAIDVATLSEVKASDDKRKAKGRK